MIEPAKICGLCGHEITLERCGSASYQERDGQVVHLCHADDHSCYHLFTVHGRRRPNDE